MVQFYKAKRPVKKTPPAFECEVSALDHRLLGVVHHQQATYFTPDVLPTERIRVQLMGKHQAKLVQLLQSHPHRIQPACRFYHQCGGCQGQILSSTHQLQYKAEQVSLLITQLSGYTSLPEPTLITGPAWHYRRAARLATWFVPNLGWQLGFRQEKSKQVVTVDNCLVLSEVLNPLLAPLSQLLKRFPKSLRVGHVELYDCLPMPTIRLRVGATLSQAQRQACIDLAQVHQVSFLLSDDQTEQWLHGDSCYYMLDGGLKLAFIPGDFIQVNAALNQKMVNLALDWLDPNDDERILDLFSGVGNFTLPIAKRAKEVVAIEGVEAMTQRLSANAALNHCFNVTALSGDLNDRQTLAGWLDGIDKVLLDPARAGAKTALESVAKARPKAVVYIACDPATMARDIALLRVKGYQLQRWALIDMFSQTSHIETAVLLTAT
ncbi:23S rRNA (uracil(1939)-C(5))-methyltransferase RlmD [Celerinatantimonas yamalensis]|uniref:23S rRNA (Uracil(1939)-C(5))-methyltransferase RlmD n=1 Tax=Celerinatantimonas yamalensis TaxID=559956 RepID=A0ABW9G7U8_9GAMM